MSPGRGLSLITGQWGQPCVNVLESASLQRKPTGIHQRTADPNYPQKMAFLLHQHRTKPALQQMPPPMVLPVEPLRVTPVERSHAPRQARRRRFDQQMVVIAHQAILVDLPPFAPRDRPKELKNFRSASSRKIADRLFPRAITW